MRKDLWKMCFAFLVALGMSGSVQAQDTGWTFSGRLTGSASSSGVVLRADPSIGYYLNDKIQTYVGTPFYFVDDSSAANSSGFTSGLGNVYAGVRLGIRNPTANFTSNVVITAPTGSQAKGFSTGHVTAD